MSDLIIDTGRVLAEGEQLVQQVKELCKRFEREKGWPRERTAQALLAIVYGLCRSAGWSPEETISRAVEQFTACERGIIRAKAAANAIVR